MAGPTAFSNSTFSAGGKKSSVMEIPSRPSTAKRSSLDPPEIMVYGSSPSDPYKSSSRSSSSTSRSTPTGSAEPMSIPNLRDPQAPPPLPPPRFLHLEDNGDTGESDPGWQWENSRQERSWGRPSVEVQPGSSLYGGFTNSGRSATEYRPDFSRRTSSASTITSTSGKDSRRDTFPKFDEGYASASVTSVGSNLSQFHESIPGKASFQSSVHDKFQSNTQTYDKSVLQKLDSRRRTDNTTPPHGFHRSLFSSSLNDASPTSRRAYDHQSPAQKAFSMPVRSGRLGATDFSFSRWADGSLSAVSPPSHYASRPYDYRHPSDRDDPEKSPRSYLRHSASGSLSNSEDNHSFAGRANGDGDRNLDVDADFPIEETSGLRRLRIDDSNLRLESHSPTSAAGQKRRASSPLEEEGQPSLHTVGSAGDLYRRRESASRASPTPRLLSTHGSMSTAGSGPRNSSYTSTLSLAASSISSVSSYGGVSPGAVSPNALSPGTLSPGTMSVGGLSPGGLSPCALSPGGISPGGISPRSNDGANEPPYTTSSSLPAGSHGSVPSPNHQHAVPEGRSLIPARKSSERSMGPVKRITTDKLHGVFICECCPKKPKKFETEEDLNAHEQEKQFDCKYCKNRFKNKNEAERHQNSLHLRRHSWSCAALPDYSAAYHNSPARPTEADTCGYCGGEFVRTAVGQHGVNAKVALERDREARVQHLVDVHKFTECNHAKKFFRADHFRQHLKHSHAGTSGKWTNMLENACMKDEPLPEPNPASITEEEEEMD